MSNFNSADIAAFKDVWVFCEQREGKLMPTDFELISKGRDLANELGVNLCGLLLGGEGIESAAKELGGYGADKVIVCESPLLATYTTDGYAKVICDVIEDLKPEAFLIGATNIGRDLGPRCAARLHTGLCADCTHLDVDVPKMRVFDDCASGEETRYKYGTLNGTVALIEWNNDRRALFTAPIEDVQSDEILNEYGWAALVALAVREDGIQQVDCFPRLSYTAEEASERATLKTDLENYLKQAKAQFMTGEIDVEEGWDSFVNTVNGMGLERLIEIEQAAYDRYQEVLGGEAA